jgi:ABC-2 type transport system permease protein
MVTLLWQEFYKLRLRKSAWYILLMVFVLPIALIAGYAPYQSETGLITFAGWSFLYQIFIVVYGALIFANEYAMGTIRPLLSRRFSRLQIFIAKVMTALIYGLVMMLVAVLAVLIAKVLFNIGVGPHFVTMMVNNVLCLYTSSLLVLGMVLLVVNVVRSSGAAIAVGVAFTLGTNLVTAASQFLVSKATILKWNPFNILLGTNQFNYNVTPQTQLTLAEVLIGWGVYLMIFYGLAFMVFNRRNV